MTTHLLSDDGIHTRCGAPELGATTDISRADCVPCLRIAAYVPVAVDIDDLEPSERGDLRIMGIIPVRKIL